MLVQKRGYRMVPLSKNFRWLPVLEKLLGVLAYLQPTNPIKVAIPITTQRGGDGLVQVGQLGYWVSPHLSQYCHRRGGNVSCSKGMWEIPYVFLQTARARVILTGVGHSVSTVLVWWVLSGPATPPLPPRPSWLCVKSAHVSGWMWKECMLKGESCGRGNPERAAWR